MARVALTFDAEHPDRPAAIRNQDRLLDELQRLDVGATFFVQGRWAEAYPDAARRIADAGQLIGSHSHYHARMQYLSAAGLRHDLATAEAAILDATGVDPRPWFRCPFGDGASTPRVRRAIDTAGYRHVGWTVDTMDWDGDRADEDLARVVVEGVRDVDDAIVLLHTWPDRTVASIGAVVAMLRDSGATLARVDELEQVTARPSFRA